jgi:predicted dithiol-disulfide oxidoreductase (DUF899 family)
MKTTNVEFPKVVTRAEWLAARQELLAKEKEFTRRRDVLNAERRRLPMVRIEKDYVFEGPNGKASLLDLFEGRRQLIIYHFILQRFTSQGSDPLRPLYGKNIIQRDPYPLAHEADET